MYKDIASGSQVGEAIGALAAKGIVTLNAMSEYVLTAESQDADGDAREEGEDTGMPAFAACAECPAHMLKMLLRNMLH